MRSSVTSRSIMLRLRRAISRYAVWSHRFTGRIRTVGRVIDALALIASFVALGCFAAHLGFDHTPDDYRRLMRVLRVVQGLFVCNIAYNLILDLRHTLRSTRMLKWIIDIGVLITVLPWIYPHPVHPWIPWLERLLYGREYLYVVLGLYAVVEISRWVMICMTRRTNPALMLSGSFLMFIIIGSLLLMLPRCTYYPIPYVDSLFVATSAVCITGLTSVDVSAVFTPLGLTILAVLIQIGALGVLTFTSFFALFYTGSNSIYSQLMVKDLVYTRSFGELLPTLLYILSASLVIEGGGAVLIWLSVHDTLPMSLEDQIWFSVFHSVSAFANAGFSSLHGGMSNPVLLYGNQWIYWAMSLIVAAGSIGFPILVNVKDVIVHKIRAIFYRSEERLIHLWSMNTKIVLTTTLILFVAGVAVFFTCESGNTMAGMDLWTRITQSVFNSVVPRSAGFSSVSPAAFMPVTLVTVVLLMWIGGAAQSTGGGIKVNTFGAMMLNIRTIITGKERVTAFHRAISAGSMQRVHAVIAISLVSLFAYTVTLLALEPDLPAKDLVFEAVSAVFTVGSSMGITPELSGASKTVLCTAMFFGRVGIISILMGFADSHRSNAYRYPVDNIIIN